MDLTPMIAKMVLNEIYGAIRQPVNLMDVTGRIIASTDTQRIGTLHSAARRAIQENMDCLIVRNDDEYLGARIGINIPIHYDGNVIGVVGITGSNYDELSRYIYLIRMTTESLLKAQDERFKTPDRVQQQLFLESIILGSASPAAEILSALEAQFGIKESFKYCAAVFGAVERSDSLPPRTIDAIASLLLQNDSTILTCRIPGYLAIFSQSQGIDLRELLERSQSRIAALCDGQMAIGYSRTPMTIKALQQIFMYAKAACQVAQGRHSSTPLCYEDMSLERLLPDISEWARENYLRKVFAGQPEDVCRQWRRLLSVFYRCNGSVTKTAELLYVHKNTVQYQLRKIAEITGYDPRRFDGAAIFEAALMLYPAEDSE